MTMRWLALDERSACQMTQRYTARNRLLKREDQSLPNIKQYFVECPGRDAKYQAVVELYSGLTIASCVIFTHTRRSASWLAERMIEKGHLVGVLHGEMSVEERASSIEQFKEGIFKVLITTNVCARGIDVSQVTIVINYDPPLLYENPSEPDYDTYLHRIGRTGRFGKAGIAINFVDSREALAIIKKIEAFFGKPIPKLDPSDLEHGV
ncbi:helicase protein [Ancylostoma duodenale]|uniref:Helicase protein n=1 Tax=Ancylostoma duodenale TaxID=51022 RepID=A0A0C2GMF8_9BILA|nr:helicase protein [Ancylostoma duodenale]